MAESASSDNQNLQEQGSAGGDRPPGYGTIRRYFVPILAAAAAGGGVALRVKAEVAAEAEGVVAAAQEASERAFAAGVKEGIRRNEDAVAAELTYNSLEAQGRRAFDGVVAFEREHGGEEITEALLQEYALGPLEVLFQAHYGHVGGVNNKVEVRLMERDAFDSWLRENPCFPEDRDPRYTNGRTAFTSRDGATIRVPSLFYVKRESVDEAVPVEPTSPKDYRWLLMHERFHAGIILPESYISTLDGGKLLMRLDGLRIRTFREGEVCPDNTNWDRVNEATINLLVAVTVLAGSETIEIWVGQVFGDRGLAEMRAVQWLYEAAGMTPGEVAEEVYFSSNPAKAIVVLDRRLSERFSPGSSLVIAGQVLNHIDAGDFEAAFSLLQDQTGLQLPARLVSSAGKQDLVLMAVNSGNRDFV